MPKEMFADQFNGKHFTSIDPETGVGAEVPASYRWLRVGWDRLAGVSLSVCVAKDQEPGSEASVLALKQDAEENGSSDNVWLERWEINDLINVLRKARDQAFGKDA